MKQVKIYYRWERQYNSCRDIPILYKKEFTFRPRLYKDTVIIEFTFAGRMTWKEINRDHLRVEKVSGAQGISGFEPRKGGAIFTSVEKISPTVAGKIA